MYNTTHLEIFIDKVHAEASAAAQAIYDKHLPELLLRIKAQLQPKDILYFGMGSVCLNDTDNNNRGDNFISLLTLLEYQDEVQVGFNLPDTMTK